MLAFGNFSITGEYNFFFFLTGLIIISFAVYFYYKRTLPPVNVILRLFLISLRILALSLILFLIFNPKISLEQQVKVKPKIALFIDNSNSLSTNDSLKTRNSILRIVNNLTKKGNAIFRIFLFGDTLKSTENLDKDFDLSEKRTNLENVFNNILLTEDSLSSAIIITDGTITEGENPLPKLREITIPIYTIGVGNTDKQADLQIKKIAVSPYIYKNYVTPISITLFADGKFSGKTFTRISLFANNKLIGRKKVVISSGEITKTKFEIKPNKIGTLKLTAKISPLKNERNLLNNHISTTTKVLDKKKNILIVSDSPTYDITFIRNAILSDTNFTVTNLLIFPNDKTPNFNRAKKSIDKSNAIFFVSYPGKNTNKQIFDYLRSVIKSGKSFYFELTETTDIKNSLKLLNAFNIKGKSELNFTFAQAFISDIYTPFLDPADEIKSIFENLPPVKFPTTEFIYSSDYKNFLLAKINSVNINTPFALYNSRGNSRSILFMANGLWKWKLQNPNPKTFDKFFTNISVWLTNNINEKLFTVRTDKKTYSQSEEILLSANLYNELLDPVKTAVIKAKITSSDYSKEIIIPYEKSEYSAKLNNLPPGEYTVKGAVDYAGKHFSATTFFKITTINIEKSTATQNIYLLTKIAEETNAGNYNLTTSDKLPMEISKLEPNIIRKKNIFIFFPKQKILIFIILLFTIEWIIRKLKGLL